MPSAFLPLRLVFAEADRSSIEPEEFKRRLFDRLKAGSIAAQSDQAFKSNLKFKKYDDLNVAVAELGISFRNKNAISSALRRQEVVHLTSSNGYITINPEPRYFHIGVESQTIAIPGPEILPFFWDCPNLGRGRQMLISMDWIENTRSIFNRVAISAKDLRDSGLLATDQKQVPRGRATIYGDQSCDEDFVIWFKRNPLIGRDGQIAQLREIYKKNGHRVGKDERGKAELRKIKAILP